MVCGHNVFAIFMSFPQLSPESLFEEETELWMNFGVRKLHLTSDLWPSVYFSSYTVCFQFLQDNLHNKINLYKQVS